MKKLSHKAPIFTFLYPYLSEVCRKYGYALTLHGSMERDLDLVCVPWTEHAKSAEKVIEAIREAVSGCVIETGTKSGKWNIEKDCFEEVIIENPIKKPHGRLAWNIHTTGGIVLDISVLPRTTEKFFEPDGD